MAMMLDSKWPSVELGEIYDFSSGLSKDRSEFGFGYPFLSFVDVFYNYSTPEVLTELVNSTESEREKASVKRGDVFLTRTSETVDELGMSCVALIDHPEATFNGFTKRLRPRNPDVVYPEYAAYFFRSYHFRWQVYAMSSISTRASLNNSMLSKLKLILPPMPVQIEIANTLSSLDKLIRNEEKICEKLQSQIIAVFRSWFIDFDPVKSKAEGDLPYGMDKETAALFPTSFEDSVIGRIPKGWVISSVWDSATFINGAAYKDMHFCQPKEGLPVVKIAELKKGFTKQTAYTNTNLGEKYRMKTGDILFSWSGSPETSIDIFLWDKGDAWLNQHIFRVDSDSPISRTFNFSLLKHLKHTLIFMAKNRMTTGLGHVTKVDLQKLMFVDPPIFLRERFHQLVGPLLEQIVYSQSTCVNLSKSRDALLPRLMSGELLVS